MSNAATSPAPLSPAIRGYLLAVVAIGSVVLVQALFAAARTPQPLAWVALAALALLSGWFRLSFKSVSATAGIDDTFWIAAALLFGPGVATLAVAAHSLVYSLRRRRPIAQMAFNASALALSMWCSAGAFFSLAGVGPLAIAHAPITPLVGPLLALTGVYFVLNSGLTAIALGLDSRQSPFQIWKQNFRWL